jgi:hypothetical protein
VKINPFSAATELFLGLRAGEASSRELLEAICSGLSATIRD